MDKIEYNKQLIEKYPFLLPKDYATGQPLEDYDYSFTELDSMSIGWKKHLVNLFVKILKMF